MTVLQDVRVGGEGNAAAIEFSRSNGQCKTDPASSERQCLLIQCTSRLLGEADQLRHSRQQNVAPTTGWVTPPWRSSAQQLDGLGGCSSRLPSTSAGPRCRGEGEHPFPCSSLSAPLLRSALPESCELQQLLLRRGGPANPAAMGGSSWIAKKQCNAHAKRGAMLITNRSGDAAYCCVVICAAVQSQEECLSPEGRELT